jgi:monoamine oxidase
MSSKRDPVTRRRFVAGTMAGGVALGLPAGAEAVRRRGAGPRTHADVVVVGAGFAGLTAARRIVEAGRSAIVLEARDRVGGRVWNHDLGHGRVFERGAAFVGPTQDHLLSLARELRVDTFPTYDSGDDLYVAEGVRLAYSDRGPFGTAPPDPAIAAEIAAPVEALDQLSSAVPVSKPWAAADAAEWDGQTLDSWLRARSTTPAVHALAATVLRALVGAEPRELSLLFTLFYVAAAGDARHAGTFQRAVDTRQGAQMSRFHGGSQEVGLKLAARLGDRVVLNTPVRRIAQRDGAVSVASDRLTVQGRRVIVAIPPTLAGRIDYDPKLPSGRDQLTQGYRQGTLTRVAAVYDRPFWRDQGLTGTVVAAGGPVSLAYDGSPPGGTPGVVLGFVGGDDARHYDALSPARRRAAVLAQLESFFGSAARHPRDVFETIWSREQWSRGCPVGIPGVGVLTADGSRLREPVDRIHWAGTETAIYWNGYMDGAVSSGERAAAEVLAEL